jgi:hypothetical protein
MISSTLGISCAEDPQNRRSTRYQSRLPEALVNPDSLKRSEELAK